MVNKIMCLVSFLLFAVCLASAYASDSKLGIDFSATTTSKYIWRGYDILDDHSAFQPSLTLDFYQTGFTANLWGSFALASGFEDLDELDYTLSYCNSLYNNDIYKLEYTLNFIYYDFPNTTSKYADVQEINLGLSLPNLIKIGSINLIPSWYICRLWPSFSGGPNEGIFNIFKLSYDIPIHPIILSQTEQNISLFADLTHNDGAFDSEAGFSHSTVGISTSFEWRSISLIPALNYQWSFEDTVNNEDEVYGSITLAYSL